MELQLRLGYHDNDPWSVALDCGHKIAFSNPSHLLFICLERDPLLSVHLYNPLPPVLTHSLSSEKALAFLSSYSSPGCLHISKAPSFLHPIHWYPLKLSSNFKKQNIKANSSSLTINDVGICVNTKGGQNTVNRQKSYLCYCCIPVISNKYYRITVLCICAVSVLFHYSSCQENAYPDNTVLHTWKSGLNILKYSRCSKVFYNMEGGKMHTGKY